MPPPSQAIVAGQNRYRVTSPRPTVAARIEQAGGRRVTVGPADRAVTVRQATAYRVAVRPQTTKVVTTGVQGPPGVPGAGAAVGYEAENRDAATLPAGTPVAVHPTGTGIVRADATTTHRPAVGLLLAATAVGFAGTVQVAGVVTLGDWTAVTGTATLARGVYFLGTTPGTLTLVPPTAGGAIVQPVGRAVSPEAMDVSIHYQLRRA